MESLCFQKKLFEKWVSQESDESALHIVQFLNYGLKYSHPFELNNGFTDEELNSSLNQYLTNSEIRESFISKIKNLENRNENSDAKLDLELQVAKSKLEIK